MRRQTISNLTLKAKCRISNGHLGRQVSLYDVYDKLADNCTLH